MKDYYLDQYFLIIHREYVINSIETLDETLGILWKNGLLNSHILIQDAKQTWSLYTFVPYQSDCFTLTHIKMASFTPVNLYKELSRQQLYPQKLNDFKKCLLYIAVFRVPPFIILNNMLGKVEFDGIYI